MKKLFETPIFLLLLTGVLIGMNFPLGKIAGNAGVSPILWAFLISFGAAISLLPVLASRNILSVPRGPVLRYALISGLISFGAVNLLVFSVIPHVGSGFTALMFALSPVFTLAISVMFKLKAPKFLGVLGIIIGFAGAGLVAYSRQSGAGDVQLLWMLGALLIPVTLAAGNVYRTLAWPKGQSPDALAFWSHLVAAVFLLGIFLMAGGVGEFSKLSHVPVAALLQAGLAGITFPVFFRLQQYGGPVLLSQIGYVAAAVGLFAATLFLNETYGLLTWVGAGVIMVGIGVTILAQREPK